METYFRQVKLVACCFSLLAVFTVQARGELTVEPEMLFFQGEVETLSLQVFNEGLPIAAPEIKDWKFYTDSSSYRHMINVSKKDQNLAVSTTGSAEDGSYLLVVTTEAGELRIPVRITFSAAIQSTPSLLTTTGTVVERRMVLLDLEPFYLEGTRLDIDVGSFAGHTSAWWVNGELVSTDSRLFYSLDRPGPLHIVYEEHKGVELAERVEARSEVRSRGEEVLPFRTKIHGRNTFHAPQGYDLYRWFVDDQLRSESSYLEHVFVKEGLYEVRVEASHPADTSLPPVRRITYQVEVSR